MKRVTLFLICVALALAYAVPSAPDQSTPEAPNAPDESPASNRPKELGWQSLFWGLFALALLAMSQPSIGDRGFPQSKLLFPMRSSPFVCMADIVDVVHHWGAGVWGGLSISEAALEVKLRRHRDRLGDEAPTLEATPVEKDPVASLILFVGVATQAVKILACKGVPWAQVTAVSYIGSYVLLAALSLASQSQRNEGFTEPVMTVSGDKRKRTSTAIATVTLFYSIGAQWLLLCFGIGCIGINLPRGIAPDGQFADTLLAFIISSSGFGSSLILIEGFLKGVLFSSQVVKAIRTNSRAAIPTLSKQAIAVNAFAAIIYCCMFTCFKYKCRIIDWLNTPRATVSNSIIILFPSTVVWAVLLSSFANQTDRFVIVRKKRAKASATSLAITNLVVGALYYAYGYDPKKTVKPLWIEKLG